jgi:hypothetical protein
MLEHLQKVTEYKVERGCCTQSNSTVSYNFPYSYNPKLTALIDALAGTLGETGQQHESITTREWLMKRLHTGDNGPASAYLSFEAMFVSLQSISFPSFESENSRFDLPIMFLSPNRDPLECMQFAYALSSGR